MIKKLLLSKAAKIILAGILVAFIGFFLYRGQEKPTETENTKPIAEKAGNEEPLPEKADFFEDVKVLKQWADNTNVMSQWSDKERAITDIGEKLKEILASDSAELLTNGTFVSDEFSVVITDYPLHNGTIRRVKYTLKDNDEDTLAESRFFLQYIGENTFFSDIEHLYTGDGMIDEYEVKVFENTDGCFIFLISSGYEYEIFNSDKKIVDYYARIYIPREDEFYVEQHVDIPLKIALGRDFRLIQQDNVIKGIVTDYENNPECIFNSSELVFELQKGILKSEPVDYDMPGLLLGLSDSRGNVRTLFIRKEGGILYADEYAGQIIISRENKLFSVKPYILGKDFREDDLGNETTYRTGSIDIKKLLCAPLGIDLTDDFERIFNSKSYWEYYSITDIPLYIGEDYICYIQNSYGSGGGTYHEGASNIRFDKLDNLADFALDGLLSPNFKETTLADLVYGNIAKDLYKEDISTYGANLQSYVDFRQMSIKRNLGKWSLMLPIIVDYFHSGNGSYYKYITAFAAYDNDVPKFLDTNDEAIELDSWRYWDAKDLFGLPGSEADLILYDYFIEICSSESDFGNYNLSIPVNFDEYIVSINFADDDTQKAWARELHNE